MSNTGEGPDPNSLGVNNPHGSPTHSATSLSVVQEPDLTELVAAVETMKQTLSALVGTFNNLGEQTARVASLKPQIDTTHQVKHIRQKLKAHEQKQETQIEELRTHLSGALKDQIAEQLRSELKKIIEVEVQLQVRDEVTRQLVIATPGILEKASREHRRQILEIRKNLHNSESRRANSLLKSNNLFDPLHPLLRPNGEKSSIFPRTLAATFACGVDVSKLLCREFHLAETESKESNLNRFLHHIGVGFQMVATPMSTASETPIIADV